MRMLIKPRCMGKTTSLLYASELTGIPICVCNALEKKNLVYKARDISLDIPDPIVVNTDYIPSEIFVDNLTDTLYRKIILKYPNVKIVAATISGDPYHCILEF